MLLVIVRTMCVFFYLWYVTNLQQLSSPSNPVIGTVIYFFNLFKGFILFATGHIPVCGRRFEKDKHITMHVVPMKHLFNIF